jgi:hypothetical protein
MDIKTMTPDAYAQKLLEQGVPPDEILERMAHDFLVTLAAQLQADGVPPGFENLAKDIFNVLMEGTKNQTVN